MTKEAPTVRSRTISDALTSEEFQRLSEVPPEAEWFANITNSQTRRAYQNDLKSFMHFVGITRPEQFRTVTRAHVLAWRNRLRPADDKERDLRLQNGESVLSPASVRRKLSALAALFDYLC